MLEKIQPESSTQSAVQRESYCTSTVERNAMLAAMQLTAWRVCVCVWINILLLRIRKDDFPQHVAPSRSETGIRQSAGAKEKGKMESLAERNGLLATLVLFTLRCAQLTRGC